MKSLELKVHPPIVLFVSLILTYGLSHFLPLLPMPSIFFGLHWYIGASGILVAFAGIWEFRTDIPQHFKNIFCGNLSLKF